MVVDCDDDGDDVANVEKKNDATVSLGDAVVVAAVQDEDGSGDDDDDDDGGGGMTPSCMYKLPRAGIKIRNRRAHPERDRRNAEDRAAGDCRKGNPF